MIISIYGTGYVGLVSAVSFACCGHKVIGADIDESRVRQLNKGISPLYEKNLDKLLQEQLEKEQLYFTSNLSFAVTNSKIHIVATGTPGLENGEADLSQVYAVIDTICQYTDSSEESVIVIKSTVPVGTNNALKKYIRDKYKHQKLYLASNPEFLREGSAIKDFLHAQRIIIGGEGKSLNILQELYKPLTDRGIPLISMSTISAELTKYAANVMLASRISLLNKISELAEKNNGDIDDISKGIGSDSRIGNTFLKAGIGYGGSCFPKDVRALAKTAKESGVNNDFFEIIDKTNTLQKNWAIKKLQGHFNGRLQGLRIGLWGLAFKPQTDDLREAVSLTIIKNLTELGVSIYVYDPVAMDTLKSSITDDKNIFYAQSIKHMLEEKIDSLIIATEWQIFKNYPLNLLGNYLDKAPIFDGRNCYSLDSVKKSTINYYYSVGRPTYIRQNNAD